MKCYLPAMRFASGLDTPIPPALTKLIENVDSKELNKVLQPYAGLTLSRVKNLSNDFHALLNRNAGSFMIVGSTGPQYNHWVAYNAWKGILYAGGSVVRVVDDDDRRSKSAAKAVFTDDLLIDDLREVYVIKTFIATGVKKKKKRRHFMTE